MNSRSFRLSPKLFVRQTLVRSRFFAFQHDIYQKQSLFSSCGNRALLLAPILRCQHSLRPTIDSNGMQPKDVPNPSTCLENENLKASWKLAGARISDPDKLLSSSTFSSCEDILSRAACEIGVAVISSMSSAHVRKAGGKELAVAIFAKEIHDLWGIGSADKNDGVLIFIAVDDRVFYVSVGEGMLHRLDAVAIRIIFDTTTSILKEGNLDQAVQSAVRMVSEASNSSGTYRGEDGSHSSGGDTNNQWKWILLPAIICLLFFGVAKSVISFRREGKLEAATRVAEDDSQSCPHCLEPYGNFANRIGAPKLRTALACGHAMCTACVSEAAHSTIGGCGVCLSSPARYRAERYKHYYGVFLDPEDGFDEFIRDVDASLYDADLATAVASFQSRIRKSIENAESKRRLLAMKKRYEGSGISTDVGWAQNKEPTLERDTSFGGGKSAKGGGGSW